MKIAATFLAAAGTWGLAAAQAACPGITVTSTAPKSLRPGATVTYQLKITNTGATTATGLGLLATLPGSAEYMSVKALPKPASTVPNPLLEGNRVTWTGISIPAGRTQTLKVAIAVSSCAADTVFFNANVTGPNDCVSMAPRAQSTLKRSPKDIPCAPTPAPTAAIPLTCETLVGTSPGGEPVDRYTDWSGSPSFIQATDPLDCADKCLTQQNKRAFTYVRKANVVARCGCYTPAVMDSPNYGSWVVYCQVSSDIGRTYFTGSRQNPYLETGWNNPEGCVPATVAP